MTRRDNQRRKSLARDNQHREYRSRRDVRFSSRLSRASHPDCRAIDLAALGYDGSYNRVAAFARDWKAARQREEKTSGRGVFVPLAFSPGEAFQFDWSEDWAIINGERTKLQVAHFKLSYSRAFVLRAYAARQTR